jgi:hypothetical protein
MRDFAGFAISGNGGIELKAVATARPPGIAEERESRIAALPRGPGLPVRAGAADQRPRRLVLRLPFSERRIGATTIRLRVWIEVAGAAQVAQLRRTVTRKGRKTVEVRLMTGDAAADPATSASWVLSHWPVAAEDQGSWGSG